MSQNNSIFIPKKAFESHLKAVLEGLNVKFFFVAQRWWVTLFRQIVSGNLTLIIITNLTGLLAANWLQKLETKHCHCVYYAGYLCSYVWVFVSVWQLKTDNKKKLYDPFLWMGFNCLKATATLRRQFTFYHSVPRKSWYSFYWPWKDKRLPDVWIGNPVP